MLGASILHEFSRDIQTMVWYATNMEPRALFRRYTEQCQALAPPGFKLDTLGGLTRYTPLAAGLEGVVMFSELDEVSVDAAISEQTIYFRELNRPFEWKVHALDTPPDLGRRLEAGGFQRGTTEAFMVYRLDRHSPRKGGAAARIKRITTTAGIRQVVSIQENIWGQPFPWLESSLGALLPRSAVFCAYRGDEPVGTGWVEFPEGGSFAELHGGAVLASERGRGIYSALFDIRAEEAGRRGFEFLAVDAAPMSRPILLRKGFITVCETTPFRKSI